MLRARIDALRRKQSEERRLQQQQQHTTTGRHLSDSSDEPVAKKPRDGGVDDNEAASGSARSGSLPKSQGSASTYMMQRVVGQKPAEWEPGYTSVDWWARPLHNSVAVRWDSLFGLGMRPLALDEACAGTAPAHLVLKAMQVPLDGQSVTSDLKPTARAFQRMNIPEVAHLLQDMKSHAAGKGFCTRASNDVIVVNRRPDVIALGPPCQPFTTQRADRSEKPSAEHALFNATFGGPEAEGGSLLELARARQPPILILEQVHGFTAKDKSNFVPLSDLLRKL